MADDEQKGFPVNDPTRIRRMANLETRIEELESALDIDEYFLRSLDEVPDKPGRTALGEIELCKRDAATQ